MAFTEFCCRSGGSNLNAGTRTGNSTVPGTAASFTYASGSWVASTGVFTVASGDPATDGVAVGDFASVYADGSTVTGFIGRVTAVSSTTITVSLSAKSGTAPTDGSGTRTLKIGGAWKGPNAAENFPFSFHQSTCTNAAASPVRVSLMNDATYNITATINHAVADANAFVHYAGFSSSYGDSGRAKIDGGTSGASFVLFNLGGAVASGSLCNMEFCNNGATGSEDGARAALYTRNVVVHDVRGSGMTIAGSGIVLECEAYNCNQSNTANKGGFACGGTVVTVIRCIAHDNSGSNTDGFFINGNVRVMLNCVAETNGRRGLHLAANSHESNLISGCDFYNNGGDGINHGGNLAAVQIENCNFVKNGGWGVNVGTAITRPTLIANCGFGSGTQANTSGTINNPGNMTEVGTVTYAADVTPWNAPTTGDFRVSLAAAKGAGRGTYTQTQASYTGTVGYPDIGSAQHVDAGGGGGIRNPFRSHAIG